MTSTTTLGVDPGARDTGLVLVRGDDLLAHAVIHREDRISDEEYVCGVLANALSLVNLVGPEDLLVAVESVTPPVGFRDGKRQPINPGSLIATSAVMGAFIAWAWTEPASVDLILVPPAGNGSAVLAAYPPALVGAREAKAAGGILKHCRSAWDVAQSGQRLVRRREMARR